MKYTVDSDVLYKNLQELLAQTGLNGVNKRSIQRLLALSADDPAQQPTASSEMPFKDERFGLLIPPPPPLETYGGHWHRLEKRFEPEEFLSAYWSNYTGVGHPKGPIFMCFAHQLRQVDQPLETALRHRAKVLDKSADELFYSLGIMTRKIAVSPPAGLEYQASLFKQTILWRQMRNVAEGR